MSGGWKEQWEDYNLDVSQTTISGQRGYVELAAGNDSLPSIGDQIDSNYPKCLCRNLKYSLLTCNRDAAFAGAQADYRRKVIATYSTSPIQKGGFDEDERRFQMGGEILTIDNPTNWTWDDGTTQVAQPMFISNAMGSFTRKIEFESTSTKNNWIADKAVKAIGGINHDTFEGFRYGSVLWTGLTGGTQYSASGDLTWVFELEFSYRIIRDEEDPVLGDDWLFLWRKDASAAASGKWDKPKDGNGNYLYAYKNFPNIFGSGSVDDV